MYAIRMYAGYKWTWKYSQLVSGADGVQMNMKYSQYGSGGGEGVQTNRITLRRPLPATEDNDIKEPLGGDARKFKTRRPAALLRASTIYWHYANRMTNNYDCPSGRAVQMASLMKDRTMVRLTVHLWKTRLNVGYTRKRQILSRR